MALLKNVVSGDTTTNKYGTKIIYTPETEPKEQPASDFGLEGRAFESSVARHLKQGSDINHVRAFLF